MITNKKPYAKLKVGDIIKYHRKIKEGDTAPSYIYGIIVKTYEEEMILNEIGLYSGIIIRWLRHKEEQEDFFDSRNVSLLNQFKTRKDLDYWDLEVIDC